MSNILKVTTPAAGFENPNTTRMNPSKNPDPSIQGPVNPDKVVRPDARSDSASQEQNVGLKFQYESNYDNFIQQMRDMPTVTEEFSKVFFEQFTTLAESGMGEGFTAQMAEFLSMIDTDSQDLLSFVKNQGNGSIRYTGAFFTLLRQVMKDTGSVELRGKILDFVKRYADMSESPHVMQSIKGNIESLEQRMFPDAREELAKMAGELNYDAAAGSEAMGKNAEIIKDSILPFLNQYVKGTHDRGDLRDLAAHLASLTARIENSTGGRLTEAFDELMKYQGMQKYFQGFDPTMLMQVLGNTEYEKAVKNQKWMTKLAELVESGVAGAAGSENKAVFQNLMQSILLNESVYMPVLHMMVPVQVNGQMMFAEMWVDPDAEGKNGSKGTGKERCVQGLVKFDIKDVGFFDLYFVYQGGSIQLQMNCPKEFEKESEKIRHDLVGILAENSIRTDKVFVEVGQDSIPISEAFPKIFERKNSINVRI